MIASPLDVWDYAFLACLFTGFLCGLTLLVIILGLPDKIAVARNHPDAEATHLMGWVGFLAIIPWIQALIWAFKPTDKIDIRRYPEAEARATIIWRLAAGCSAAVAALLPPSRFTLAKIFPARSAVARQRSRKRAALPRLGLTPVAAARAFCISGPVFADPILAARARCRPDLCRSGVRR